MLLIRSLTFAAAFYITTIVMLLGCVWMLLAPRKLAIAALKLHGRICICLLQVICGTRLEVRGRENMPAGACLIIAKHQSTWDTFALLTLFDDPAIVLKDELKWIPLYGWFCLKFEHILVKRDRAAVALKQLVSDGRDRVAANRQVVIFPEGTRQAPGAASDYKPGYIALYDALGVPCVPIALNSGLYWPRRSFQRYPGTIVVDIRPAIPPGQPRAQVRKQIEAEIEAASDRLLGEAASSVSAPPMGAEARQRLIEIKNRT